MSLGNKRGDAWVASKTAHEALPYERLKPRAAEKRPIRKGKQTMRKATHVLTHNGSNPACGYCATSRALTRIQAIKRA